MFRLTVSLILLCLFTGCAKELNQSEKAYLSSIDGNYIVVEINGRQQRLRLCGVDIPATQVSASKKLIQNLTQPSDGLLIVWPMRIVNADRIVEVYTQTGKPGEEKSINAELIVNGIARLSNPENCSNHNAFIFAQDDAKERRVGIWK